MGIWEFALIGLTALAAGIVNALAGGGTLITFPVLTAFGIPAVGANITNTIALCPGYFGGVYAQRSDLKGQKKRMMVLIPAAVAGGIVGGILLLMTGEKLFRGIVPWLILFAAALLAFQPLIKRFLENQKKIKSQTRENLLPSALMIFPGSIYGGYFGAGLGVILLAILGISHSENMIRLNALKQTLSLSTNVATAFFFLFSKQVNWPVALIMAICALLGGYIGGKIAKSLNPEFLRWIIVGAGVVVFFFLFFKW